MTEINVETLQRMFAAIANAMAKEKDRLCELDGVIGDADHGIAMELGFSAASKAVAALEAGSNEPSAVFNTAAKAFLNAVGASSGPLYATAFMRAGAAVKGKGVLSDDDLVEAFIAMAKGIQDRGKAELGEKTMIDAWIPAAQACHAARAAGAGWSECLGAALQAATKGAEDTKAMVATKGRSSRLGERSIGHMDPGAASAVVLIGAMAEYFEG
ncbi:dihydroxyacetone kinase subunit L [Rhizobium sp. P32RR-XVIII]|uniref:dihydroxyacetone kinase subunit DhaL n=1 Tax=Rhizobium sp. P32RR-XVIII TaxID=2726738 RepID=UPI00145758D2|nr:dihydroxyacetone kinase subunit DhaL [Rhizobium sp. P32RR-XVIII]NLS03366.1 dihydroxyacetone kinase subunit L [Rhizobium sp. P32RR-XVIII]